MKIKTIDINVKEWFDKANGNSYFAGSITVNYGLSNEKTFIIPFQYGYDEHFITVAKVTLQKQGFVKSNDVLWRYCKENKIVLRTNKELNCKKRELMQYEN